MAKLEGHVGLFGFTYYNVDVWMGFSGIYNNNIDESYNVRDIVSSFTRESNAR